MMKYLFKNFGLMALGLCIVAASASIGADLHTHDRLIADEYGFHKEVEFCNG